MCGEYFGSCENLNRYVRIDETKIEPMNTLDKLAKLERMKNWLECRISAVLVAV
jgi:hypothetical protein